MIRRTTFAILVILFVAISYMFLYHLDWVVAGPPDDFKLNRQVSALENVVQSAIPEKPVTNTPQDTSNDSAPVTKHDPVQSVTETPKPLPTGPSADYDVTAGGFENRCYYLGPDYPGDVLYTTVIISGYDPNDHTTFPYKGDLDDHNAPATAAGSQAWCSSNDPYKSER